MAGTASSIRSVNGHARSWTELLDQLYAGSWNAELGRHRLPFAYRGLSTTRLDLSTALLRLGRADPRKEVDLRVLERSLLRNFRKYAHDQSTHGIDTVWHWLAMGQHHGLPTRLVDWTYSPLVALHFATARVADFDQDGVIWCVNFVEANRLLPDTLAETLEEEQSQTLTLDMLSRFDTLEEFDDLATGPFVVFVEPPSLDVRMLNQFALFSLMPGPGLELEPWLAAHRGLARRVVVPSALKWEIRDKLDQANISERTLFPGLDGLSRWLARYYLPRYPTTIPGDGRRGGSGDEVPEEGDPDPALSPAGAARRGSRPPAG
jgi:hypothetical protein